ncbi:MAG: hypothetical protein IPK76_22425 [Lewinellaceae bacterium]|nr:hypothetical protein [Lewinellaceae bacterium]
MLQRKGADFHNKKERKCGLFAPAISPCCAVARGAADAADALHRAGPKAAISRAGLHHQTLWRG